MTPFRGSPPWCCAVGRIPQSYTCTNIFLNDITPLGVLGGSELPVLEFPYSQLSWEVWVGFVHSCGHRATRLFAARAQVHYIFPGCGRTHGASWESGKGEGVSVSPSQIHRFLFVSRADPLLSTDPFPRRPESRLSSGRQIGVRGPC